MQESRSEPAVSDTHAHGGRRPSAQGSVVERLSRYGMQVLPSASQRRTRLQRQQEVCDSSATDRASITPAMRKKYLKELFLNDPSHSGFSSVLTSQTLSVSSEQDADWTLCPWSLHAVEGNYETIVELICADPYLLTRKEFISGYSVLHWLAKRGQDEIMVKLLQYAENAGIPVNVNLRGSGGFTPLHVACMHSRYMVIKLLVGAFSANVDVMDYSGRRAWQYLKEDAPPEMKELLGTWDDEHIWGCAQNINTNVNNNNCGIAMNSSPCDEVGHGDADNTTSSSWTVSSIWRSGSIRKMLRSFPFSRNKS
ncbi:hypothetical protein PAMA_017147 [Pampus argenteus]